MNVRRISSEGSTMPRDSRLGMVIRAPATHTMKDRILRTPPATIPKFLYRVGLGSLIGGWVLLLTTIGRKSGQPRVTPLQYEEIAGDYYLGSMRGVRSDWYRNAIMNPRVDLRVGSRRFHGVATGVEDRIVIADFLRYRLHRHPRMIGTILAMEGLSRKPTRRQLERYADSLALLIVRPLGLSDPDRPLAEIATELAPPQ